MKSLLMIALFFCLISGANAKPNIYNNDDRYFRSAMVQDTVKAIKKKRIKKVVMVARRRYTPPAHRQAPVVRFLADAVEATVTPIRAMGEAVMHGIRPSGCPARAWCGCFLSKHLGLHRRDLWLARNWARVGSATSASPGAIVVWRHHVGRITAVDGHRIKVLSGNDGRRVRERWRSMAGVIAFRRI